MAKRKTNKIDFPGLLIAQLGDLGYAVTRELRFHAGEPLPVVPRRKGKRAMPKIRRWRFDIAFEALKLAIEVDGGLFSGGRHSRGAGIVKDFDKINAATLLGWRVLRVSTQQVNNGYAATLVRFAVAAAVKGWKA